MREKSIIAITGPSGVGKTTLGKRLALDLGIQVPRHCTTRLKRNDDIDGFYRYLSHDEYKKKFNNREFLISSGDAEIISCQFGNFYGVLKSDCIEAWKKSDKIILYVSYKDIYQLIALKEKINIDIVNLIYNNIAVGVEYRLKKDEIRLHTEEDISKRINSALEDECQFGKLVKENATSIICTDDYDIEQTFSKACSDLKLVKKR